MVDTGIPGSFIPHDTSVAASPRRRESSGGLSDLLLLASVVLFVASVALAIGVFLYGQYLSNESANKLQSIDSANKAFQPELIQQFTRLDDRMHSADRILGAHIAPSLFFKALETATLQTISFQTLDFQATDNQNLTIKMSGVARGVNSIALQADLFSKNGVITSPIFSNIARQQDGVHFNLSAAINPAAIKYASPGAPSSGAGGPNSATPPAGSLFGAPPQGSAPASSSKSTTTPSK